MRSSSFPPALLVALAVMAPGAALAAWQPDGTPLSPAPASPSEYYSLRGLAADAAGGAYAVWELIQPLPDFSGSNHVLAAQRVDMLGNRPAPWAAGGSTIRSWLDSSPSGTHSIAPLRLLDDHAGGAILPVIDYALIGDYVNVFRLYHVAPGGATGAITIMGTTFGGYPVLDAAADVDGAGGVVMVGHGQTFGPPPGPPPPSPLFVERVDALGNAFWFTGGPAPGPELVPAGQAFTPGGLAALSDGVGGGFFAWVDLRNAGDQDIYLQHIAANGANAAGWPVGGVQVCGAAGAQSEPHLASDHLGGVFVVWRDERGPISNLYASHVLASGVVLPGLPADGRQLPSSSIDDRLVEVASDGAAGCFVVRAELTPALLGISRLHSLDSAVEPHFGWPAEGIALNTLSPGDGHVGVVADPLNGAFVSYRNGFGITAPQGLYAKDFGADGLPAGGWTSAGSRLSGTGQESKVVRSNAGAIFAWTDTRTPYSGVYAQRLVSDTPVPTLLALVSASADAGSVSLRWYAADAAGLRATVERRAQGMAWETLAEISADGTGALAYQDSAVAPGTRYGYRVRWLDGATTRTSAETWITVPAGLALALDAPRPNPAQGSVSLSLTLPDARGARLDVLDLAGRRVAGRDLASLGAGRHVLPLDEVAALAPGVYTLRLAQGGAVKLARMCVVR